MLQRTKKLQYHQAHWEPTGVFLQVSHICGDFTICLNKSPMSGYCLNVASIFLSMSAFGAVISSFGDASYVGSLGGSLGVSLGVSLGDFIDASMYVSFGISIGASFGVSIGASLSASTGVPHALPLVLPLALSS